MNSKKSISAIPIFAVLLSVVLIVFSDDCIAAAISGFDMWLLYVMPSIFPFLVCMGLLSESGIIDSCGSIFTLFLSSALSSAPSGARLCNELYEAGRLKESDLCEFCAYCNMASPAFLTGTISIMAGREYVLPVMLAHYFSALMLLFFNRKKLMPKTGIKPYSPKKDFFNSFCRSIDGATKASVKICGVIIFFTVLMSICVRLAQTVGIKTGSIPFVLLMSALEMTNGCSLVCSLPIAYSVKCGLLAFIISFSGICIMAQSGTFFRLDGKKYLSHKLLTAFISGMTGFVVSNIIPHEKAVFSAQRAIGQFAFGTASLGVIAFSSIIGGCVIWLFSGSISRFPRK